MIFGDEGFVIVDDFICFEVKLEENEMRLKDLIKFLNYVEYKIKLNLKNKVKKLLILGLFEIIWKNNNLEFLVN